MRERQEKRVSEADANNLYQRIQLHGDTLSYASSVTILNDLAHLIVPVDHNKQEFKTLIRKIKRDLSENSSLVTTHNYELVEALSKLKIDTLNDLMRSLIRQKTLSRGSKDIAIQIKFFGDMAKQHGNAGDSEIVDQLCRELRYLSIHDLQAE